MKTILTITRIAVAVIGLILCGLIIANADSEMAVADQEAVIGGSLDGALWITYILIVLIAAAAVLFGLINVARNPKKNMGAVLGTVAMVLILLVAYYGFADNYVPEKWQGLVTPGTSQWSGAGLMTLYVIMGASVAAVVYAEVNRLFK